MWAFYFGFIYRRREMVLDQSSNVNLIRNRKEQVS